MFILTQFYQFDRLSLMNRSPDFIRYFVVFLIIQYILSDGHLLCAHFHCSHTAPHGGRNCGNDHSCRQSPKDMRETCVPCEPCDHECNGSVKHAFRVQRNVDESVNLLQNLSTDCVIALPYEVLSDRCGYRDAITDYPSALSVRLHLLYRSLLI